MSFLAKVSQARDALKAHGRVSVRALGRDLGLKGDELDEIVEELVDIQKVAKRDGKVLVWVDGEASDTPSPPPLSHKGERGVKDYTPKHLADKILASRSAMEGEKKQVTVLFCDVAGSMDLAEALGPEAWHETLNEFFEVLTAAVHEFEGTVNQYTGDGIMALFGAPIAAEDHARRACMAAIAIQEKLAVLRQRVENQHGEHFTARIGINSGEVVVGKIGDDLRMDYTAQGQVVGIAARLEALAAADGILLSAYTAGYVEGYFDLSSLGAKTIKGLKQPLEVFQLGASQTETTRFELSRRQGLTKFVGRKADMATLESALQQAQAGNGQVVGVVAEAGTGKSRLCYEFLETCRARGMTVLEGHALSHAKNIPFLPMLQVFKAYYGIKADDDDRTAREKIAGRMVLLDEKFRDLLPVQFEFFGIADPAATPLQMAPEAKQRQLISILRQIVQGADPGIGNIIAYIEDLHWLDEGSETFLEEWVDALAGTNGLLLVNFRPEYRAEWMQKSYYRQIPLAPLSPNEVQEMLTALLGPEPSVAGLAEIIFQRTGGNPFFCEEVVKSLQESGVLQGRSGHYVLADTAAELDIPVSVQSVLAARIDHLSDDEKTVLQTASVIGRVFPKSLLAQVTELSEAVLDSCLATLKSGEFIFQRAHGASIEYIFKHALTQEVSLNSQLSHRLKETHAKVARAIENLNADAPETAAPLIAHHWEHAGEALTAAQWFLKAADHISTTDIALAMKHMQSALRITEDLPGSQERDKCRLRALATLLARGTWRISIGRQILVSYAEEALRLAKAQDNKDLIMNIKGSYALALGMSFGDLQSWHQNLDELVQDADGVSREMYLIMAGCNRGYSLFIRGMIRECLETIEPIAEELGGDLSAGQAIAGFSALLQLRGLVILPRAWSGDFHTAFVLLREHLKILEDSQFLEESLWAVAIMLITNHLAGRRASDNPELSRIVEDALQKAEQQASSFTRLNLTAGTVLIPAQKGDPGQAVKACDLWLAEVDEIRTAMELKARTLAFKSEALLLAGQAEVAEETARQGVELAHRQGAMIFEIYGRIALVRTLISQDKLDEVPELLEQATALIETTGAGAFEPQVSEQRGRLAAALGDTDTARQELETAHKLYVKVGADGHAERLARELPGDGHT